MRKTTFMDWSTAVRLANDGYANWGDMHTYIPPLCFPLANPLIHKLATGGVVLIHDGYDKGVRVYE